MVPVSTYVSLLEESIAFRSISADPTCRSDLLDCAKWYRDLLKIEGFTARLYDTSHHPIVYGKLDVGAAETVCVYGHYDVQPAALEEGWPSDPFKLTLADGTLRARGTADNKGQTLMHLATIFALRQAGKLRYNVEVLLEGDEESFSGALDRWLAQHAGLITADWVLVSDGQCVGLVPAIDVSYRGGFNLHLEIKTADADRHSGIWGGIAPNSLTYALQLGAFLNNEGAQALMTGWQPPPPHIKEHFGGSSPEFRAGFLPSAEPTSALSGLLERDARKFRNAIPGTAILKINCRTSPLQNAAACELAFREALIRWGTTRKGATLTLGECGAHEGVLLDIANPYAARTREIVAQVCGEPAPLNACGASIPAVTTMAALFKKPLVMLGLANEECGMHAVGEHLTKYAVMTGLTISHLLFSK